MPRSIPMMDPLPLVEKAVVNLETSLYISMNNLLVELNLISKISLGWVLENLDCLIYGHN